MFGTIAAATAALSTPATASDWRYIATSFPDTDKTGIVWIDKESVGGGRAWLVAVTAISADISLIAFDCKVYSFQIITSSLLNLNGDQVETDNKPSVVRHAAPDSIFKAVGTYICSGGTTGKVADTGTPYERLIPLSRQLIEMQQPEPQ